MKDRFISLLGALAALYIFVALFVNPNVSDFVEHSAPSSVDQGEVGLQGLFTWLENSNVPVYRLQTRYKSLEGLTDLKKRGNIMIVTLPQITPARDRGIDYLQSWLKQGNSMLVLVATSDSHLTQAKTRSSSNKFLQRFGFRLHRKSREIKNKKDKQVSLGEAMKEREKKQTIKLTSRGMHPLTNGIKHIHGSGNRLFPQVFTLVSSTSYRSSLALLSDQSSVPAFWETRYGNSRVWVSRFAYLFSNSQLGDADNARLIANIVSAGLSSGGKVVFDDTHQGSTELYDKQAFFSDSRLHNTLWFIFAFWILYVIGHSNRIAPLVLSAGPPRASDFVRATASLFARRLSPVAAAKLLFSHFFDWIRLKYSLPTNGQPVWQLLENTERIDKVDLADLRRHYAELQKNRKINLLKLVNKMQKMRSALS